MTLQFDDFNKNLLLSTGKSILDVGCGVGRYWEWAVKHDLKYSGVDVDGEVVKKAILKFRSHPKFNPDAFNHTDGKSLSMFPDKNFDTVLLVEVIEHVVDLPTLENLMKECMRVAKKNIMITTPNCSDEEFLRKHRLVYDHYTHSVGQGYSFKMDSSHHHHLRFTKDSLSQFLSKLTDKFEVVERKPIEIITAKVCYYKLWAEIIL